MKNKTTLIFVILAVLLSVTGFFVYKSFVGSSEKPMEEEEEVVQEEIPIVDSGVSVTVESAGKANTVLLSVSGLAGTYASVAYELSYDSNGLIKGVNSGSKPIDVSGKTAFEREIYLGTCSRNVCTPDPGVTGVTVVLQFTDTAGEKSQFSGEFDL